MLQCVAAGGGWVFGRVAMAACLIRMKTIKTIFAAPHTAGARVGPFSEKSVHLILPICVTFSMLFVMFDAVYVYYSTKTPDP